MKPTVCLFESDSVQTLEPLHYLHASWELLHGAEPLAKAIQRVFPDSKHVRICRPDIAGLYEGSEYPVVNKLEPGKHLFVNGQVLDPNQLSKIDLETVDVVYMSGETVVAALLDLEAGLEHTTFDDLKKLWQNVKHEQCDIEIGDYLWQYVKTNTARLREDAKHYSLALPHDYKNVVLDDTEGPIIIDQTATIGAFSVISGPVYIGPKAIVSPSSTIRPGTSIGAGCKVGGEIAASIMMPLSNKAHYGFLGHSYIGSWCNLAAGVSSSNMKNTLGTISVEIGSKKVETDLQFAGMYCGDHTKIGGGIHTSPGTVIGPFNAIMGIQIPPRHTKPLQWLESAKDITAYDPEKAITVAERTMARREQTPSPALKATIQQLST